MSLGILAAGGSEAVAHGAPNWFVEHAYLITLLPFVAGALTAGTRGVARSTGALHATSPAVAITPAIASAAAASASHFVRGIGATAGAALHAATESASSRIDAKRSLA